LAGVAILVFAIVLARPLPPPFAAVVIPLALAGLGLLTHAWHTRIPAFAFAAGLVGNGVAAVLVYHWYRLTPAVEWWIPLVQANAIVFGATALLGLWARWRFNGARGTTALLRLQVGLGFLTDGILIAGALGPLLLRPAALPAYLSSVGGAAGWLALALTTLAGVWYVRVRGYEELLNIVACVFMAAGVLAACAAVPWDQGRWLSYHILTLAWAALAVGILGHVSCRLALDHRPAGAALRWLVLLGGLVLLLGLRGATEDYLGPGPSVAALVFVSCLAADLALSRRSEGWAFVAGLPFLLAVSIVLWVRCQPWDPGADGTLLAQANLLTAGVCTLVWLAGRRRLYGTATTTPAAAPLLAIQLIALVLGNGFLLVRALAALVEQPQPGSPPVSLLMAGAPLGWATVAVMALAAAWYSRIVQRFEWTALACAAGLVVTALAACSCAGNGTGWLAYHVLLAGWTLTGCVALVHSAFERSSPLDESISYTDQLHRPFPVRRGVLVALLVLGLAVRGAVDDPSGPIWSITAVFAIGLESAVLSVRQRIGTYAVVAALCLGLAFSLLPRAVSAGGLHVWGWVGLLQANTITAGAAAFVWLAAARRIKAESASVSATASLTTLVLLALAGNLILLVPSAVLLAWAPGQASTIISQAGGPAGWVGWLLFVIAAGRYAERQRLPGSFHELCGLGLSLGILVACSTAAITDDFWLAYHTLMVAWAVLGLAVLISGWRPGHRSLSGMPRPAVLGWLAALAAFVSGLALRVMAEDPLGPWAPAAGLLVGALFAGALALWTGRQSFVWAGGLLLVGVVEAFGIAADVHRSPDWAALNLAGQAMAATVCSAASSVVRRRWPGRLPHGDALPFTYAATLFSLLGVVALGVLGQVGVLADLSVPPPGPLGWTALGSVLLALVVALWDPDALFPLAGLYAAAFAALGFALSALPSALPGPEVVALAAFVTLAAVLWRTAPLWRNLARRLGIPRRLGGWPSAWFGPTQALLGGAAVFLSVWLCLSHAGQSERFSGPVALALLLPGGLLAVGRARPGARNAAFVLGVLLAFELIWVAWNW
jgi:hypothetical protein